MCYNYAFNRTVLPLAYLERMWKILYASSNASPRKIRAFSYCLSSMQSCTALVYDIAC